MPTATFYRSLSRSQGLSLTRDGRMLNLSTAAGLSGPRVSSQCRSTSRVKPTSKPRGSVQTIRAPEVKGECEDERGSVEFDYLLDPSQ